MCVNDVCVIKLIGWKMDGWIGLSGCGKWMESGKWMWMVESGKWKVESGAVPDLTHLISRYRHSVIALLANYVTVVEGRPIMSVKYCLPVPVFHFWL